MKTNQSIARRLRSLEATRHRMTDAEILAWGDAVTDEELSQLIDLSERFLKDAPEPSSALEAKPRTSADAWRYMKPYIEHFRANGWRLTEGDAA